LFFFGFIPISSVVILCLIIFVIFIIINRLNHPYHQDQDTISITKMGINLEQGALTSAFDLMYPHHQFHINHDFYPVNIVVGVFVLRFSLLAFSRYYHSHYRNRH
jgi:hypothetical protein